MFQTKVVEKLKTHILCSVISFRKSCHIWDNVEKFPPHTGVSHCFFIVLRYARYRMRKIRVTVWRHVVWRSDVTFHQANPSHKTYTYQNTVERGMPLIKRGTFVFHAGYLRLQIHTLRLCNTHGSSTATMETWTRLSITLYVHCCLVNLTACKQTLMSSEQIIYAHITIQ